MKKIKGIIRGFSSLFETSNINVLEKYPSTHEKDARKALEKSWDRVGKAMKGALSKYEETEGVHK